MEKVPARLRGLISGFLQQGYAAGNLLAALCYFLFFQRWGWRALFFIGGLPALLALFIRFRVKESEVWERIAKKNWSDLRRTITGHWKLFLYLVLFTMMMNLSSHGTQDLYPTFLQRHWHFNATERSGITAISMIGAIIGGVIAGYLSDRFGRKRIIVSAFILAAGSIPWWACSPSLVLLVSGAFIMQFMVQGAWGVIPAHLTELSPDSTRSFLPGFSYQCGVLLSSSVAYIEAVLAQHVNYATAMVLTALSIFALGSIVAAIGPERHGAEFGVT
jgi:SHS family lactate transporter-like MFS transporter